MRGASMNALLILLGLALVVGISLGAMSEKRATAKKARKLEAQRLRQERWRKRRETIAERLMPWRRG